MQEEVKYKRMDYSILIINGETEKKVKTGGTDYERFGEKSILK